MKSFSVTAVAPPSLWQHRDAKYFFVHPERATEEDGCEQLAS